MKPGTIIRLKDGRLGTTVYHNIDGYGIVWGWKRLDPEKLPEPDAMLRKPYPGATCPCVGEDYELVDEDADLVGDVDGPDVHNEGDR